MVIVSQFIFRTHVHRHFGKYTILAVIVTLITVFINIGTYHIPYERDIKKKERKNIPPKKKVRVAIAWTDHKEKGLLLPRLSMANGEILPACFLSLDGVPISTALCVTLEELHWTDSRHCDCQVSLVLDDAPAGQLLREGNSLYLYHNYQQVAVGRISGDA